MENSRSEMSQDFISSNSAVEVPTQSSATQIFLIKEDIPNSVKKGSQELASNFHNLSEQHQFVRITQNSSSSDLLPNRSDKTTMILSTEVSQNELSRNETPQVDTHSYKKKQRNSNKKKHSKSSEDGSYTCDKCKKSFTQEASLKAHVRRTYCQEGKSLVSTVDLVIECLTPQYDE